MWPYFNLVLFLQSFFFLILVLVQLFSSLGSRNGAGNSAFNEEKIPFPFVETCT